MEKVCWGPYCGVPGKWGRWQFMQAPRERVKQWGGEHGSGASSASASLGASGAVSPAPFPVSPCCCCSLTPHDLQVRSQLLSVAPSASVSSLYRLPIRTSSQPVTCSCHPATSSPYPPFLPQRLPPLERCSPGLVAWLIPSSHHAFTALASSVKPPGHSGSPAPSSGRQTPSL